MIPNRGVDGSLDEWRHVANQPNAEVRAVHPKAMPVIPIDQNEWQAWLGAVSA